MCVAWGLEAIGSKGTLPRWSGRQLGGSGGKRGQAFLVRIGGRLGDLDQGEPDGVELGVAPSRSGW